MRTALRLTILVAAASLACQSTPDLRSRPKVSASASTAPAAPLAPPPVPWRFFAIGVRACLGAPSRGTSCGQPREERGDRGAPLLLRPVVGTASLVEAATRDECFRTADAIAFCNGREVGRGVKSVAGVPYLLREDGTVVVARAVDPLEDQAEHPLREAAAGRLPLLDRLVATELATCGLARTGEVWCWPEPAYPYDPSIQVPVEPRPARVPGLDDAVDLALMPWLTLCVRTGAGAILCSAAPARATEVCVLLGKSEVRCGPTATGGLSTPGLAGAGYDPRGALARPLVRVPGIDGATTLSAYPRLSAVMRESPRRMYVSGFDEGGCAELASGGVRC